MSAPSQGEHGRVDVVRKVAIVVVLLVGLVLLHRVVGTPTEAIDPRGLLALGFVVLASYAIGELAEIVKLPHITGYLLAGLVLGPSAAHQLGALLPAGMLPAPFDQGVLNEAVIGQLGVLDTLALPLICLTAGGELDLPQIRKTLKTLASIIGSQVVLLTLTFMGFAWVIGGTFPAIALPAFEGVPMGAVLALGGVLASLAVATSTAATIAIIVGSGARGPMTSTLLNVAVGKDAIVVVMFAVFTGLAANQLGTEGAVPLGTSLWYMVQSVIIGVGVGGLIHLYLRFVKTELLLFLVGLIFTVSWLAPILHAEIALIFITAGLVIHTWSDHGDPLIAEVERLSLPVYVVFFTLAGARLHLDVIAQMAGFAFALVVLRTGALWVATRAGATLGGADPGTKKHGWLGMIAQAGLSISLASQLPQIFPGPVGEGLFALILAGVAVHEMAGPALAQLALSLGGELGEKRQEAEGEAQTSPVGGRLDEAVTAEASGDPWAPRFHSSSPELEHAVAELQLDLVAAVDAWVNKVGRPVREEHERWLHDLRRALLRSHRQSLETVRSGALTPEDLTAPFQELDRAWRALVLSRAVRPGTAAWTILGLLTTLDARVDSLEVAVDAPVEADTLRAREEPPWRAVPRWWLRQRTRLGPQTRQVALRDLARFHLSGMTVGHLEGLATQGVQVELQLTDDVADAFALLAHATARLATRAAAGDLNATEAEVAIWAMRDQAEEKLRLAMGALPGADEGGRSRAAAIVGSGLRRLKRELAQSGTLDLPYWTRRMGRAYAQRNRGMKVATEGLALAREAVEARYRALAMEMEVTALEVGVAQALQHQGAAMRRLSEDLGLRPLRDALDVVDKTIIGFTTALDAEAPARELSERLRDVGHPAVQRLREQHKRVVRLVEQLQGPVGVGPVRDTLLEACGALTESYTVPAAPIATTGWNLGAPVTTTERRLRQLALAFVETQVAGQLDELVGPELERFAEAGALLGELERVLGFNLDVARGELEALRDGPLPADVRALVSDMLFGAPQRLRGRLAEAVDGLEGSPEDLATRVEGAVTTALGELRQAALDPQGANLSAFRVREAVGPGLHVGQLERRVERAARGVGQVLEAGLGPGRLGAIRRWMGVDTDPMTLEAFAPPRASVPLPQFYERLFGSQGLAGSGQLVGRRRELIRAQRALDAPLHRVALVGPAGSGSAALAQAVWQRHGVVEPRLIHPLGPVRPADVDAWFADEEMPTELRGLGWLFTLAPGGAAPLERLAAHLVDPARKAPWVICADAHIWHTACNLAPLADGVADVVELAPLSPHQLEEVLLARHRMSAYSIGFEPEGLLANLPVSLGPWSPSAEDRRRRAWFAQLHAASAGHLADAMRLWLAAVVQIDEEAGHLVVGPVPTPPLEALRTLHPRELAILRHVLRQGWVDVDLFARAFRTPALDAQATLAKLYSRGLLHREQGRYFLASHLREALGQVLRERGWAA